MAQKFFLWMGTAIFLLALVIPAAAQDYPTKPINLVIQYPPGGSTDLTARALANGAKKYLGQPVICENKVRGRGDRGGRLGGGQAGRRLYHRHRHQRPDHGLSYGQAEFSSPQ